MRGRCAERQEVCGGGWPPRFSLKVTGPRAWGVSRPVKEKQSLEWKMNFMWKKAMVPHGSIGGGVQARLPSAGHRML